MNIDELTSVELKVYKKIQECHNKKIQTRRHPNHVLFSETSLEDITQEELKEILKNLIRKKYITWCRTINQPAFTPVENS